MPLDHSSAVDPATQMPSMMGHNKPPKDKPKLFGLGAAWLKFAEAQELRRLAILHCRIERRERALRELRNERTTIMNRCIRRMRRAAGKN